VKGILEDEMSRNWSEFVTDADRQRRCGCDYCAKWCPLWSRLRALLTDESDQELFDEFVNFHLNIVDELSVAESKLEGSWPGWESRKDHPLTP
jgi:epoxyqueuosine reductase QueG